MSTATSSTRREASAPGHVSRDRDAGIITRCATQVTGFSSARRDVFPRGPP
jgi:hypothetical protein